MLDGVEAMRKFLFCSRPTRHFRMPIMLDSSKWEVHQKRDFAVCRANVL